MILTDFQSTKSIGRVARTQYGEIKRVPHTSVLRVGLLLLFFILILISVFRSLYLCFLFP